MLFSNRLSQGDIIGTMINQTNGSVVRIRKYYGMYVAYTSDNVSENYTIISKELLASYVALTGTAQNRVVLTGIFPQADIDKLATNAMIQTLPLTISSNGTSTTNQNRFVYGNEFKDSGLLEGDIDVDLLNNVSYLAMVVTTGVYKKVLAENSLLGVANARIKEYSASM